jgi:methylenetetrahydrofolate reductase (NADPH)
LSAAAARYFHAGKIPGCVVTDALLELVEKHAQAADKGRQFFLEFAAKQCAIAKGLGFRGAYLGGHLKSEEYERILEIADGFAETDWKDFAREISFSQENEFYFFEPDSSSGLNSTDINREYLHSKTAEAMEAAKRTLPLSYKANRAIHRVFFEKGSTGFALGKRIFQKAEELGPGFLRALHAGEQAFKIPAFDCRDCGDCSLPDIAYLCPESQCAKNQRNGPCGGTRQGKCEVGEKDCIWALAYDRLKPYGAEERMLDRPVVIKDAKLEGTSAWANTFLERDHHFKIVK